MCYNITQRNGHLRLGDRVDPYLNHETLVTIVTRSVVSYRIQRRYYSIFPCQRNKKLSSMTRYRLHTSDVRTSQTLRFPFFTNYFCTHFRKSDHPVLPSGIHGDLRRHRRTRLAAYNFRIAIVVKPDFWIQGAKFVFGGPSLKVTFDRTYAGLNSQIPPWEVWYGLINRAGSQISHSAGSNRLRGISHISLSFM